MKSTCAFLFCIIGLWTIRRITAPASPNCNFDQEKNTQCCSFLKSGPDPDGCYDDLLDSKEHTTDEYWCALECTAKTRFGYKNYTFDPHKVENYFNRLYAERREGEMLIKVKRIFQFCEQEVKHLSEEQDSRHKSSKCSIYPTLVVHCLMFNCFIHCPKNRFNPTNACYKFLNRMRECTFNATLGLPVK